MSRKLFVNLPVRDLTKSVDFFTTLGFTFNPQFTDERAACMIVSDDAFVMLLVEDFFNTFTNKRTCNSMTHSEAIIAMSVDSKQQVDDLVNNAFAAGAQPANEPVEEGFMYGWSFQDLDGHLWEVIHMDPKATAAR